MSDDHDRGNETPGQLSLFPGLSGSVVKPASLPVEVARASVSPGWWALLRPLWTDQRLAVTRCREEHGVLRLAITSVRNAPGRRSTVARSTNQDHDDDHDDDDEHEGEQGRAQEQEHDEDEDDDDDEDLRLQAIADELIRLCAQTCGCCGGRPAKLRTPAGGEPARVLCDCCAVEIGRGIPLLVAADAFWRLDGARRPPGLIRQAEGVTPVVPASDAWPLPPGSPSGRPVGANRPERFDPLPAPELRALVRCLRSAVAADIIGQDEAVARLALAGALHVGGGLTRGQRTLIIGPSGVGKTSLIRALCAALAGAGYELPVVTVDAVELTSPGWSGAPSIHELLGNAFGERAYDSPWARHAVVAIDELHHVGLAPGGDVSGNMAAKRREVFGSLLGLLGHGTLKVGPQHRDWSAREALVVGLGAFEGLLDTTRHPSIADLGRGGLPVELATRFHEVLLLRPLGEGSLAALLRRWPAFLSLRAICERLGYDVVVHPETVTRAARAVVSGADGATPRTAGGWMVTALQDALLAALEDPGAGKIELTPDSLRIARSAARPPADDDSGDVGNFPRSPW